MSMPYINCTGRLRGATVWPSVPKQYPKFFGTDRFSDALRIVDGPRALNLLSSHAVDTAKPREREFYLRDGGGLFVRVYPSGLRRACYRFDDAKGRTRRIEHPLPMGRGPGHLTLEAARFCRDEMTTLLLCRR